MFRANKPILLGSGSPRRREFLAQLGLELVVRPPEIDESLLAGESPERYLERIVLSKLDAVRALAETIPHSAIVVADTSVVLRGAIFGKPVDEADSLRMLSALNGTTHQVMTRYAVSAAGRVCAATISSDVVFRSATEDELLAYVASGEGVDKAGGYAIQGIGASLVQSIVGSYSAVVGLPVAEVVSDLVTLGAIRVERP